MSHHSATAGSDAALTGEAQAPTTPFELAMTAIAAAGGGAIKHDFAERFDRALAAHGRAMAEAIGLGEVRYWALQLEPEAGAFFLDHIRTR